MPAEWVALAAIADLPENQPFPAAVDGHDLVVVRTGDDVRVLSGRCPHRCAKLSEHGRVEGGVLTCQRHGWDFRVHDGRPPQGGDDGLGAFAVRLSSEGRVQVDRAEILAWARDNPSAFRSDEDVS